MDFIFPFSNRINNLFHMYCFCFSLSQPTPGFYNFLRQNKIEALINRFPRYSKFIVDEIINLHLSS